MKDSTQPTLNDEFKRSSRNTTMNCLANIYQYGICPIGNFIFAGSLGGGVVLVTSLVLHMLGDHNVINPALVNQFINPQTGPYILGSSALLSGSVYAMRELTKKKRERGLGQAFSENKNISSRSYTREKACEKVLDGIASSYDTTGPREHQMEPLNALKVHGKLDAFSAIAPKLAAWFEGNKIDVKNEHSRSHWSETFDVAVLSSIAHVAQEAPAILTGITAEHVRKRIEIELNKPDDKESIFTQMVVLGSNEIKYSSPFATFMTIMSKVRPDLTADLPADMILACTKKLVKASEKAISYKVDIYKNKADVYKSSALHLNSVYHALSGNPAYKESCVYLIDAMTQTDKAMFAMIDEGQSAIKTKATDKKPKMALKVSPN